MHPSPPLSPKRQDRSLAFLKPCGTWLLAMMLALPVTGGAQQPPSATVQTARLDSVWTLPERSAAAQVLPRNESRLAAEVGGTLQRWTVDVGATVRQGDLLAQIDPTDHELALRQSQAALDAAQARLALAEAQLQRSRELVAQGFFSQEALAQRETEVALTRAELARSQAQRAVARRQLDKTRLRAPFHGSVVQRLAQTGETVVPGTVLYVLTETSASELSVHIAAADAVSLRAAQDPRFEPQSGADTTPRAVRLLRVSPTLNASARTQSVRLAFEPGAAPPPPGTSGLLRWRDPTPHIPATLVIKRGASMGVFIEQAGVARFIALGEAQEGRSVATTLPADTPIVVQGQNALQDGQSLR